MTQLTPKKVFLNKREEINKGKFVYSDYSKVIWEVK